MMNIRIKVLVVIYFYLVREKSRSLVELLNDQARLDEERE